MIAFIALTVALILAGLTVAILVLAWVGARRENPAGWLATNAPGPLAGLARRILGLHVRRPSRDVPESRRREPTAAGQRR